MPPVKTNAARGNLGGVFLYHHEESKDMGAHEDLAAMSGNRFAELQAEGVIAFADCRYGRMHFLRTDIYIAQSLGLYGEFSESEVALWRRFVKPGDTVVSGGANCGAHVLALARLVGPLGSVITVEPQQVQYEIVCRNLQENEADEVEIHHAAFGRARGRAYLPDLEYRWPFSFGSIGTAPAGKLGDVAVDQIPIDELVGERNVSFIHLDCEGNEPAALLGAEETILRCRPVLYVEVDRSDAGKQSVELLARWGYQVMLHHAPLYNPDNVRGNRMNVFGDTVSISAVALPGVPQ